MFLKALEYYGRIISTWPHVSAEKAGRGMGAVTDAQVEAAIARFHELRDETWHEAMRATLEAFLRQREEVEDTRTALDAVEQEEFTYEYSANPQRSYTYNSYARIRDFHPEPEPIWRRTVAGPWEEMT